MQKDIKQPKVDATAEFVREINYDLQVEVVLDRFKRSTPMGNAVFCCVDSIVTRKHIWDSVRDNANFFCDGRMTAEVLRILTACDEKGREHYPQTLFTAEQAHTGRWQAFWNERLCKGFGLPFGCRNRAESERMQELESMFI